LLALGLPGHELLIVGSTRQEGIEHIILPVLQAWASETRQFINYGYRPRAQDRWRDSVEAALLLEAAFASPQLLVTELLDLRVPLFGSPPHAWATLASLASGGLASGGVLVSGVQPPIAVIVGSSLALFLTIALPISEVLGRSLAFRLGRALGVPEQPLLRYVLPTDKKDESDHAG
jgi:hypothetical protein